MGQASEVCKAQCLLLLNLELKVRLREGCEAQAALGPWPG